MCLFALLIGTSFLFSFGQSKSSSCLEFLPYVSSLPTVFVALYVLPASVSFGKTPSDVQMMPKNNVTDYDDCKRQQNKQ